MREYSRQYGNSAAFQFSKYSFIYHFEEEINCQMKRVCLESNFFAVTNSTENFSC